MKANHNTGSSNVFVGYTVSKIVKSQNESKSQHMKKKIKKCKDCVKDR